MDSGSSQDYRQSWQQAVGGPGEKTCPGPWLCPSNLPLMSNWFKYCQSHSQLWVHPGVQRCHHARSTAVLPCVSHLPVPEIIPLRSDMRVKEGGDKNMPQRCQHPLHMSPPAAASLHLWVMLASEPMVWIWTWPSQVNPLTGMNLCSVLDAIWGNKARLLFPHSPQLNLQWFPADTQVYIWSFPHNTYSLTLQEE